MLDDRITTYDLARPLNPDPARPQTNEPVSVHILDTEDTVLFGTGFTSSADRLIEILDRFDGPDVIVVEHGDPDHYDALPSLLDAFEAEVAIPDADASALEAVDVQPDVRIGHDELRWGVRTIHVPGHTPGNTSFLHEPTGTLFVGDTFVHTNSFTAESGSWHGQFAPIKAALNDDTAQVYETMSILANYDFDTALTTHGLNVFTGAYAEFETLLADLARNGPP